VWRRPESVWDRSGQRLVPRGLFGITEERTVRAETGSRPATRCRRARHLRKAGDSWQTRINADLRKARKVQEDEAVEYWGGSASFRLQYL